MKKSNYRYFVEAAKTADKDFLNIQGFADADGYGDSELLNADASPAAANANAPTSAPYIISVTNNTTANVSNVVVLGAGQNLPASVTNYGNPTSITISMGVSGITYGEFLFQTLNQPFTVGLTYLQSSNASQILTPYTLQHKQATGRLCQDPIIPLFDPYQNLSSMTIQKRLFTVDGNTMLTFSTIYASATLNIYLFPSNQINIRRGLLNAPVEESYASPKIVQGQTLTIAPSALQALSNK